MASLSGIRERFEATDRPRIDGIKSPPFPDIDCRNHTGESVSFEPVEFLDREFHATLSGSLQLKDALYEHLSKLPAAQRDEMQHHYGDADIRVNYKYGLSYRKRKLSIPEVLSELLSQREDSESI
jgi:hypothetical protein